MNRLKLALISLLFSGCLFISNPIYSQPVLLSDSLFQKTVSIALDSLYDLNFSASQRILKPYKDRYPNHPIWNFWAGLELWWQILPNLIDDSRDSEFFFHFKKCDYEATRILQKQAYHMDALILKILANGFLARQYANRDQWIKSLNYARIGIESLLILKKKHPELVDIEFGDGLYDYYMDYLPKAYPWLQKINWVLPDGNKQKGLAQLAYVAEHGLFLKYESLYFLANINQNYEKNFAIAEHNFETLVKLFPHNPFYAKRLVQVYLEDIWPDSNIQKSVDLLNDSTYKNSNTYVFFEESAAFRIGRTYLKIGQSTLAENYFQRALHATSSLKNYKKRYYYGAVCYYLGHIYLSRQNFIDAQKWLKEVPKSNNDYYPKAKNLSKSIE